MPAHLAGTSLGSPGRKIGGAAAPPYNCWAPPTLANGKLYVRNAAGDLACVEVAAPKQS